MTAFFISFQMLLLGRQISDYDFGWSVHHKSKLQYLNNFYYNGLQLNMLFDDYRLWITEFVNPHTLNLVPPTKRKKNPSVSSTTEIRIKFGADL